MPPSSRALPPDSRADKGLASSGGSKDGDGTIADWQPPARAPYHLQLQTQRRSLQRQRPRERCERRVRAAAVGGLRGEAAASAEWHTQGMPRDRHHAKTNPERPQTGQPTTNQKPDTLWRQEPPLTFSSALASRHPTEPNTAKFGVVVFAAGTGVSHSQSSYCAHRGCGRLRLEQARTISLFQAKLSERWLSPRKLISRGLNFGRYRQLMRSSTPRRQRGPPDVALPPVDIRFVWLGLACIGPPGAEGAP